MIDDWRRGNQARRLSRRRLLGSTVITGAGLAGWALAGCGGDDDEDPPATTGETTGEDDGSGAEPSSTPGLDDIPRGGTFRVSTDVGFDSLDPHGTVAAGLVIIPRIYNRLLSLAPASTDVVNYDLATAWEQPDDVTYVFSLRDDVVIGANDYGVPERPLTVDDVVANIERNRADASLNGYNFFTNDTAAYGPAGPGQFQAQSTEVNAFYIEGLVFFHFVPPELIERGNLGQEAVGGGPYLLDSFSEGQEATLVRNPNFYLQPYPFLDGFQLSIVMDRAARRTAFVSGQTDLYGAQNVMEAEDIVEQVDGVTNYRAPAESTNAYALNVREDSPFTDPRLRKAVIRAIDRDQFIDTLLGEGGGQHDAIVWSIYPRYQLPAAELEGYQGYDPVEATALFEAAGYGDGLSIELFYPTIGTQLQAPILTTQLNALGIEVTQRPLDFATWLEGLRTGSFQTTLTPTLPSPPIGHFLAHRTGGPLETGEFWTGFSDAEVDAAIEAISRELDDDARLQLILDAQRLIYEKVPAFIPMYSSIVNTLIYDYVKGYRLGQQPAVIYLTDLGAYIDK